MLVASYNRPVLGDVLVVVVDQNAVHQTERVNQDVAVITDADTHQPTGFNFFNVSQILGDIDAQGQVFLTEPQVDQLNQQVAAAGFDERLHYDGSPKFVIGYVETLEEHPNSDHLHITKTRVDHDEELQIVSGSPNIQANIKVVVAKVGAMMPSGLIIFPGELRGVASNGMICSGRELQIPGAPQRPGALILPDDFQPVGAAFDQAKGDLLFK